MASNKNALLRYRAIDRCLQNRHRQWALLDLKAACTEALREYEGRDADLGKRTIQLDIQNMRSDKLGYNAPIEVYDRKFYRYSDPDYKLSDIPITDLDLKVLEESVQVLRQFKDFSLFEELGGVIQKLEDTIYNGQNSDVIVHIEQNPNLKGLEYLDPIYQAIAKELVLKIQYRSFKSRSDQDLLFHAYILKEYNNRWFVVGREHGQEQIKTLALDRIEEIGMDLSLKYSSDDFDANGYYENTYGVTVMSDKQLIDIVIDARSDAAPYLITKPIHPSQKVLEQRDNGSAKISVRVHHNYEIESLLLSYGERIQVISPRDLRRRIHYRLKKAYEVYGLPSTVHEEE